MEKIGPLGKSLGMDNGYYKIIKLYIEILTYTVASFCLQRLNQVFCLNYFKLMDV